MGSHSRKNKIPNGLRVMHPDHPSESMIGKKGDLSAKLSDVRDVFLAAFGAAKPIFAGHRIGKFVLTKAYLNKLVVKGVLRGHYSRTNEGWRRFYMVVA